MSEYQYGGIQSKSGLYYHHVLPWNWFEWGPWNCFQKAIRYLPRGKLLSKRGYYHPQRPASASKIILIHRDHRPSINSVWCTVIYIKCTATCWTLSSSFLHFLVILDPQTTQNCSKMIFMYILYICIFSLPDFVNWVILRQSSIL